MRWKTFLKLLPVVAVLGGLIGLCIPNSPAQPRPAVEPLATHHFARGRVAPKNLDHLRQLSQVRNGRRLRALPPATEAAWDSRALGYVGPVKNQANCGSCWDFSGIATIEISAVKAGKGDAATFVLSESYVLSCLNNGGCNGDDNTTVLIAAKSNGIPFTAEYGPYNAGDGRPDRCSYQSGMKLFKIDDWGFADGGEGDGVTKTQDIKNCIKAYGAVGCAIAADNAFANARPGQVFQGSGSRQIDHDVVLVGWDDGKGAWLLRNSWGPNWCDQGYCWIRYGANLVGTEAVFAVINGAPTPPDPPAPPAPAPGLPTQAQWDAISNFIRPQLPPR